MVKDLVFPEAKFSIHQEVCLADGRRGLVCGFIYYADSKQWHYAISTNAQAPVPEEVWLEESELTLADT